MNDDEIEVYMDNSQSSSYLESLARTRRLLADTGLIERLDEVISLEIELALMGAQKAKSEILKQTKDTVRPIK